MNSNLINDKNNTISLDYYTSENLVKIETGINQTVKGIQLSKLAICVALANIKNKKLYEQIGLATFKEYIKKMRINIPYATAFEYTKIGEIYQDYQKILNKLDFSEENGLKKLLYLEQALNKNKENQDTVFNNLIKYSFRNFRKFALDTEAQSARADWVIKDTTSQTQKIKIDDECIYLEPKGIEIIWFNYDLNTNPEYKELKNTVINAIKQFFNNQSIKL